MERFLYRWKNKTKHESSTITVIAALLVERNNRFSVVVLTAGTKIKFECSYFMRKSDPDEPTWGLCDGHAEAVCYRLASVYLLTELYKLHETRDSIFEKSNDGYMLKKGIKFHLFTSHPPCGFMAKKERHFLSWKRPFVGTPHILQCSSKILISSYLGIQGALTHLLVKPIYISSVTMPRYKTVETLHDSYIKDRFEKFYTQLSALSTPEDQYVFYPPHIEIVDVDPCSLFKECYKPYILLGDTQAGKTNQIPEEVASNRKRYKNKALKVAGTIPDVNQNIGIRTLVFNIDNGIGSQEFRESVLSLQHKLVKLQHDLKEKRFKSLQQARAKLSQALNIKEALGELREILLKQVKASCEFRQQKAEEIVELLTKSTMQSTVTDELTVLYEELKPSLGKVSKNNELGQIVNSVGENVTYQKMLDDLEILSEQGKHHSWDSEFYLDLMGCDWARYMRSISNDVSRSVFD